MNNRANSNNEMLFLVIILFFFAGIVALFARSFGLNFTTAMQVVLGFIFFGLGVAGALYLVAQGFIRWFTIIPTGIVGFLTCWLPAFDYWADKSIGSMAFETSTNSVWYATGWIQAMTALAIMVIGHGVIYYFDHD